MMPGFGPDVSAKILAAIGEKRDRFQNGKQVLKMAGFRPQCGSKWKGFGQGDSGDLETGKADLGTRYTRLPWLLRKDREYHGLLYAQDRGREKEKGYTPRCG